MRRRAFIASAAAAAVWPAMAPAQVPAGVPRLGVLVAGSPDPRPFLQSLREGLAGFGYIEGKTVALEIRSAEGDVSRLKSLAAELVRLQVAILVCYQTPTAVAAKQVTDSVPIVMAGVGDAVGTGLVASLAHPGGNVTGISSATAEAGGKIVQILREIVPSARRFGALCNAADPFFKPFLGQIELAGKGAGVEIRPALAQGAAGLHAAFTELLAARIDAMVVQPSLGAKPPADLALQHRIPAGSPNRPFAVNGGLIAYSGAQLSYWPRAAFFVDKILKGASPADLPVEQPTKFDLVINTKTAGALGITVPPNLLVTADEVIE